LPSFDGKGGNLGVEKGDSSVDQPKEGGNEVFDSTENDGFDSVFDTKTPVFDTRRRKRDRSRPEYRRVRKNFKSPKRYWLERNRRKRVMELCEQHLSCRQMAEQLGVSERTVKRDLARIRPYYERQIRHFLNRVEQERREEAAAQLEGLSLNEQFRLLKRRAAAIIDLHKLMEKREYIRHQMSITIDLDNVSQGFPAIKSTPQPSFSIRLPLKINLEFKKNGVTQRVGEIVVGGHT
jgi:AraC-like DNA-binding protein